MNVSVGGQNLAEMDRGKATAIGLIAVLLGLGLTGYGIHDYMSQKKALNHQKEIAVHIESSGLQRIHKKHGISYRPDIKYSYSYDGQNYSSTSIYPSSLGKTFQTQVMAKKFISQYSEGENATGYINPENPQISYLKNQISNEYLTAVAVGILIALVGAYTLTKKLI